jgi:hypothetical protein
MICDKRFSRYQQQNQRGIRVFWFESEPAAFERWAKLFIQLFVMNRLRRAPRTAYSLRHTYIFMRLMEGAHIYQITKDCRMSVEMIGKFYAAHIKNTLDAAAINVPRPKSVRQVKPVISSESDIHINPSAVQVMEAGMLTLSGPSWART